jgi:hypothetical protein
MSAITVGTTYVVASALNIFTFNGQMPFGPISLQLDRMFGISPPTLDDLVNISSRHRPDLLIGLIDTANSQLRVNAGTMGLDPRSSTIIRQTVE